MRYITFVLIMLLPLSACTAQQKADDSVYMFSYFKGRGQDGLHLAYSNDGLKWTALKGDASFLKPTVGGKLMRDPSICQGSDGTFHMVWTTGWWDKGIGLAHSKDLVNWSEQEFLPVMEKQEGAKNCWAPEIFFDAKTEQFIIFWATTIPGKFPETDNPEDDNNHRIYYIATKDFKTFTDTKLFYEPGFNVIDSFISYDKKSDRYIMFLKNETKHPKVEKNISIAYSDKAVGPYGKPTEPITGKFWAEGPSAINVAGQWYVYFDKYREHCYGAVTSTDLKQWQDISDKISFPSGTRHGTCFEVPTLVFDKLIMP